MRLLGRVLSLLGLGIGVLTGLSLLVPSGFTGLSWLIAVGMVKLSFAASIGLIGAGAVVTKIARRDDLRALTAGETPGKGEEK